MRARWILWSAMCLLAACSALPDPAPAELLDQRTGATLSIADTPLILARERRNQAVNARDYLTMVAVSRNESGRIAAYLLVHRWSTIDERNDEVRGDPGRLVLVADGRDLRPTGLQTLPREFAGGHPELRLPDVDRVVTTAYPIDGAAIAYLGTSREITAVLEGSGDPRPYTLWRDGRPALQRFAAAHGWRVATAR